MAPVVAARPAVARRATTGSAPAMANRAPLRSNAAAPLRAVGGSKVRVQGLSAYVRDTPHPASQKITLPQRVFFENAKDVGPLWCGLLSLSCHRWGG